jgi:superfamily II DNA or RNA helicase
MTTLYPKQDDHAKAIYRALLTHRSALDTSKTGTGKTIISSHIAAHWASQGKGVVVVCPKSVVTNWERTLAAHGVTPLFVNNYEKLRNGVDGCVRIKRKRKCKRTGRTDKYFEWQVPKDTLLIFDEVQWCRGSHTQNGNLLIAAKQQGYHTLNLSATAAKDPSEMRALGYALGLHELNNMKGNNSFFHWAESVGCVKDPFNPYRYKFNQGGDLSTLNLELFEARQVAHGLETSDMPGAFKNQNIVVDLRDYDGAAAAYEQAGLTEEIISEVLGYISEKKEESGAVITDILRARQHVETLKVPHFVEQTNELLAEGKSVIGFFNFRESIELFRKAFPDSGAVIGGQKDRQQVLDDWAEDKMRVLAVQTQAGGTGVNLHDVRGEFPRVTLISPDFSPHGYKQVLGRAYRAGMKTDLLQKVMVAAGTIEEYVYRICSEGVDNMDTMLG